MGHSGPRLLGIFPASFGALSPILPSTGGEAGAERRREPLPPLPPYCYPDLLSSLRVARMGQQAPWVARSAVGEGGSGRDRRE